MKQGEVWSFETAKVRVVLDVERDRNFKYDGDDPEGDIQAKLDSGEYVAFDSHVYVYMGDTVIGSDYLGGSVYSAQEYADFWHGHRNPDPLWRNCSIMRAVQGDNVSYCHYFPDMVRNAIREARQAIPSLRKVF